jgi:NHL repeat
VERAASVRESQHLLLTRPRDRCIEQAGDTDSARQPTIDRPHRQIFEGRKVHQGLGKTGYAPGEFRTPRCISMDKRGRLFVCDRANARIQILDQDGKYLATWHQFGMPSGIAFSANAATRSTAG